MTSSANPLEQVLFEVKRTIVGQDSCSSGWRSACWPAGTCSSRACPGLAKTLAVKSLAAAIGGQFQRIQFTPDLVPADLTGTRVYRQHSGEFETSLGPVFTNLLLADEINRAPGQGAERAARGHAGAPGHDRPRDVPRARAVPGHGDAEPDRVRRHLPPAGGTGRPLHDEGPRDYPTRPRSTPSSSARCARPADPVDAEARRSRRDAGARRPGLRRPGDHRLRRPPGHRDPPPALSGWASSSATSPSAPARGHRSRWSWRRALAFLRGRDYVLPDDVSELAAGRAAPPPRAVVRGPRRRRQPDTIIAGPGAVRVPEVVLQDR